MLNKEICHKCFCEYFPKEYMDKEEQFMRFWEYEKCYCIPQAVVSNDNYNGLLISIKGTPPKECPYFLEQIVTEKLP